MGTTLVFLIALGASLMPSDKNKPPETSLSPTKVQEKPVVVLPRDAIPAIFKPMFTSSQRAEMPPNADVIGVAIGGEAHAYSINLLDRHEIVNDTVGGRKIAVTW